jgi:hypothetical protein
MAVPHGFSFLSNLCSVLHPGLKLQYFHQQGWQDEWIANVETLVREEYAHNYEGKEDPVTANVVSLPYLSKLCN